MPAEGWTETAALIDELLTEAYRFDFVTAVRVLERSLRARGVSEAEIWRERIQFKNRRSLACPAGEIDTVTHRKHRSGDEFDVVPTFIGLLGLHGTLPFHYTEWLASNGRDDEDGTAFLDLLTHRPITLFYTAATKYRADSMTDKEHGEPLLSALLGIAGRPGTRTPATGVPAHVLAFYARQFGGHAVPGHLLAGVLSEYFGIPVTAEALDGQWSELPDQLLFELGAANSTLGHDAMLGPRQFRFDRHIVLRLGPLDRAGYARFTPGGAIADALAAILRQFGLGPLELEVRPVLRADQVVPAELTAGEPFGTCLGRNAFLLSEDNLSDRDDLAFSIYL